MAAAPPRPALAVALVAALAVAWAPGARAQAEVSAEARVQAAAEALLAERFPEAAPRLAPRVLRLAADLPPGGAVRLRLAAEGVPRGHARADVVTDAGRAGWALLYVAHFDSVAVARRALARGDTVGPGAVEAAWLETTRFHGEPLAPAVLRAGGAAPTARRAVRAGEALRAGVLAWPAALDTGDAVRGRYRRGGLVLTVDATARERGAVGDAVRVHARSTGATYRVRVTGPGRADWLETL